LRISENKSKYTAFFLVKDLPLFKNLAITPKEQLNSVKPLELRIRG
jgi:hypothetical protein|tara:strand:+ start:4693 stop:4830 length:138 start_codon:yes stop_codon:yes gene_type:complete